MIVRRSGVSPMGVYGPSTYWLLYDAVPNSFGRSSTLRCPLFDLAAGSCRVWPYREATCATWFCKYNRGKKGMTFWESLRDLLGALERALARTLVLELDPGTESLEVLFSRSGEPFEVEELVGGASDSSHARRWGKWGGREREFFQECAHRAEAVGLEEVLLMGGVEARALALLVRERFQMLQEQGQTDVPLTLGRFEIIRSMDDHAQLSTYSNYDPIEVPRALLAGLVRFDGRPANTVIEEIERCDGVMISAELLRTLCDFGVLVESRF
ncbi:MAG: hypothetical protein Q8O00_06860 [Holophaga sp.]|nr:hypothetical protein [Holophaga sp.]